MKINVRIINYTTMTIEEVKKYHQEQAQILLDMINAGCYSKQSIDYQKKAVDEAYHQLSVKLRKVSEMKGK